MYFIRNHCKLYTCVAIHNEYIALPLNAKNEQKIKSSNLGAEGKSNSVSRWCTVFWGENWWRNGRVGSQRKGCWGMPYLVLSLAIQLNLLRDERLRQDLVVGVVCFWGRGLFHTVCYSTRGQQGTVFMLYVQETGKGWKKQDNILGKDNFVWLVKSS